MSNAPPAAAVREVLSEVEGGDPGEVELTPITGGASRETWLVEVNGRHWVLRRDPKGSVSLVQMEVMPASRSFTASALARSSPLGEILLSLVPSSFSA